MAATESLAPLIGRRSMTLLLHAWTATESSVEQNKRLWLSLVAAIFALQSWLVLNHVPWLDELQALLIALQSPSLSALLGNLSYEGHPPLWYMLLRTVHAIVPTASVLAATSLGIATLTQALIQFRAPFSKMERLLLGMSEIVLFEYGTIARSMALGGLFVLATAALWQRRSVWLAIAILPLCDFLFGVASLMFVVLLAKDRRIWLPGLLLWMVCSVGAALSVIPATDMVPAEFHLSPFVELTDFLQRLGGLVLPFQTFLGRLAWDGFPPFGLGGPFGVILLMWLWQRYSHDHWQRAVMFGLIGVCFALSMLVYPIHFRHLTIIGLMVIALTWIGPNQSPREQWRWRAWLLVGAVCGATTAIVSARMPFDAGPQAARTVAALATDDMPLLAFPANRIPAIFPYLGREIVQPEQGCSHSFVRWNAPNTIRNGRLLNQALYRWADEYGRSVLILERLPKGVSADIYQPVALPLRAYNGQRYYVGILGPKRAVKPRVFRSCVPGKAVWPQ